MSVAQLGVTLEGKLRSVTWRDDTNVSLCSRFARVRAELRLTSRGPAHYRGISRAA